MTTQVLSAPEKRNYKILDNLIVDVEITTNPYQLPIDSVFEMAARNNPKRSYLFVSKLIGKHIPVLPDTPQRAGNLLAKRFAELLAIPSKALFIGFAETATGLGHAVFDCFSGNVNYLHTTREPLTGDWDTIYFTEDHCHAPDQKLLVNDPEVFQRNDYLVLIDDEITTGNLCLNIIRSIQKKYPQQHYVILSLLDWRSPVANQKYQDVAAELGVKISVVSLIAGTFTASGSSPVVSNNHQPTSGEMPMVDIFVAPPWATVATDNGGYLKYTGRFGIDEQDNRLLKEAASKLGSILARFRRGGNTLCLGTGEFMHIPFLVAQSMGPGVMVQSTTRSPVHPIGKDNYAVKHGISFNDPYNKSITNFIYNIPPNHYDEVFMFWERELSPEQVKPLLQGLKASGINLIVFVRMS
jgi:hypothetical protein